MIEQTSLQSYWELKDSLGKKQEIVYNALKELRCATDMEICYYLQLSNPNFVRPRRNELVKKGLVVEQCKRKCKVTNKNAIVWRLKK